MTTFDWDDHWHGQDAMPWMWQLKELRLDFKATLFAIPGLSDDTFWDAHPDWIELAVHGWKHPDPYECVDWTYERMVQAIESKPDRFVGGFKAPGWQISDACYQALLDHGWWVADQHLEDGRRPAGLEVYFFEDGNWHGHTHNVCGNGIEETWGRVVELVRGAESFEFASENARRTAGERADRNDPRAGMDAGGMPGVREGSDLRAFRASGSAGR